MAELSKYDVLLSDLNTIETRVAVQTQNYKNAIEKNIELEEMLESARAENSALKNKILELESELASLHGDMENNILNSLNLKERETLKVKLRDLISRIDYHLSAGGQV